VTRVRFFATLVCAGLVATTLGVGAETADAKPIRRARWLGGVAVTEYYPVPEAWFVGRKVAVPGLPTKHRVDWLYSAMGVSMQGEGIGLDGRVYHVDALGSGGWVNERAKPSVPGRDGWTGGAPVWRAGAYWLTRTHRLTFPLDGGGWSNGVGRRYVPLPDVTFAPGHSKPLRYWRSIAVDPNLIPLGSKVYVAAYRDSPGHGWFLAQDVGGAIVGRHVDVYRAPPTSVGDRGSRYDDQRIYVIPPGRSPGRDAPPSGGSSSGGGAGQGSSPPSSGGGAGAP
jgi:3D (Asp-Asp-Asp) domain-containing protein